MNHRVTLLDFHPSAPWSASLASILRSSNRANLNLVVENVPIDRKVFAESDLDDLSPGGTADLIFCILDSTSVPWVRTWLTAIRDKAPVTPIIVVLGSGEPDDIFDLLRLGITDFVSPPLVASDVLPRVWRLLEHTSPPDSFVRGLKKQFGLQELIGESPAFVSEVEKIPLIAKFDSTILIMGETGTGKELFARAIHYLSPKAKKE